MYGAPVVAADVVHSENVWVVELAPVERASSSKRRSRPGSEAHVGRQHLDRDVPAQAGVAGTVDLPHPHPAPMGDTTS